MDDDPDILEQVAEAVADATPVDWARLLAGSSDDARALRRLRALERIASGFRAAAGAAHAATRTPDSITGRPALFVWGHLHALEKLGEGAFGEIYRAFDSILCREVALKIERRRPLGTARGISAENARFSQLALDEARRLARVRHPNVLAVHGAELHDGRVGIWTDLIRGRTLAERLRSDGVFSAQEAALVGLDLCRALAAVHAAGVVHGDLKAANVMQEDGGGTILVDFGSGRDLHATVDPGMLAGTPIALAPEVLLGELPGPSSDLYALGVLLFHLTTGRYPTSAASLEELLARREADSGERLGEIRPELPRVFVGVVERALAPREERFASAAEMERALADVLLALGDQGVGGSPVRQSAAAAKPEPPHNLPAPLTRFIGRRKQLRALRDLVRRRRLVTVTGAGGTGKTRLGLQAAARLRSRFPDGVWFVELATATAPPEVVVQVARAIGFKTRPEGVLEEDLVRHLGKQSVLLVLDSCEHVRGAAARLARAVVESGVRPHILATSREELGIAGETIFHLSPMDVPAGDASPAELARVESAALFVDRARRARSSFALDGSTARDVARICRRLDGLPLALELAAARVRALPIDEIARGLDDRFALLAGGSEAVPARHRTLYALIEWSHDLLPDLERSVFRQLAVFAGGFSLEAARETVAGDGVDPGNVITSLARLVEKSLVERDGRARYRMLDTVREYARARCVAEGGWPALERRHRAYFLRLAREAAPRLRGADGAAWLLRLAADHDNLRAAIDSCTSEGPDLEQGLTLANYLGDYFWQRGHWHEARSLYERLLAHPLAAQATVPRAAVLAQLGNVVHRQGGAEKARALTEESLEIWRRLGHRVGMATSLRRLGNIAVDRGDPDGARSLLEESVALFRESGDRFQLASAVFLLGWVHLLCGRVARAESSFAECLSVSRAIESEWGVSSALRALGNVALARGHVDAAQALVQESLAIARRLEASVGVASCLHDLGTIDLRLGRLDQARARLEEAIGLFRQAGETRGEAEALTALARCALAAGEPDRARSLLLESLRIAETAGDRLCLYQVFGALGQAALAAGDPRRALRLLIAADALRERMGGELRDDQRRELDGALDAAATALAEREAREIRSAWREKPLAELIAYAAR